MKYLGRHRRFRRTRHLKAELIWLAYQTNLITYCHVHDTNGLRIRHRTCCHRAHTQVAALVQHLTAQHGDDIGR